MKNIFVTGGAGYIGSVLVRLLLQDGYRVRVLDRLQFGGEPLVELLNHENFEFQRGDVREASDVRRAIQGVDAVVHLAAIVGDPACSKQPEEAESTNLEGSGRVLREAISNGVKRFIFASTCSNYGKMEGTSYLDEESPLNPISLYARTKVEFEKQMKEEAKSSCATTALRFSTVYGLSPRPRFDLTVNEFTREVAMDRELVIFGEQFWRPYCHVVDLARSVISVLKADESIVKANTYNVGDTRENYTKGMLVKELEKQFPAMKVSFVHKDEDPRDYRVSSDKIAKQLNFKITKTVPDGIHQIAHALAQGMFRDPENSQYKNI